MKIIRNLEIYSSIDSDGRIKVDYNELKKKEEIFNEMLECWINTAIKIEKYNHSGAIKNQLLDFIYLDAVKNATNVTGKSWEYIKELIT